MGEWEGHHSRRRRGVKGEGELFSHYRKKNHRKSIYIPLLLL